MNFKILPYLLLFIFSCSEKIEFKNNSEEYKNIYFKSLSFDSVTKVYSFNNQMAKELGLTQSQIDSINLEMGYLNKFIKDNEKSGSQMQYFDPKNFNYDYENFKKNYK